MSRFEPKKPSLCTSGPLLNDTFRESLSVLHAIVKSCYGPFGRLKQLHNGIGGCVTTTSQSHALLSGFSVRHPAVKLIAASICNHISTFSDCGLFAANLCCNLIDQFTNLNISPHTIIRLSKHILNLCITYLKSEDCACKMAVDFSNSKSLLSVAYSVVSSKPACMLTANEANFISTLAVKAFLLTVPNDVGSSVTLGKSIIVPVEGEDVMGSSVVSGLLIEMSDYYLTRELLSTQLTTKPLKVALFSISLSGDFCETGEGTLDVFDSVNPDIVMLDQLFALGKQIVDDHVMLLLCQKVIHPALKQYLKEQDVFAVDRLGAAVMEPLSQMTGAKPIASLSPVSSTCYGDLKNVSKLSYGFKHFLHLIPFDTSICSFVLCNRNETSLKELMRACRAAEHVLQMTLKYPWVLLGGGCSETHLAAFLRYKTSKVQSNCLEELNCSETDYKMVTNCFCLSLESVARSLEHDGGNMLLDLEDGHSWSVSSEAFLDSQCFETGPHCGCGMLKRRDDLQWCVLGSQYQTFNPQTRNQAHSVTQSDRLIFDCYPAKCNALQVAVDTAGLILDLSYVIEDNN